MKVAYVTNHHSSDMHIWSGLVCYMLNSLRSSELQIETIDRLKDRNIIAWFKQALYGRIFKRTYFRMFEPSLLKYYAVQVNSVLPSLNCDIVFSPRTHVIAYLKTEKPIAFWHDSTFAGLFGFYPGGDRLCAETVRNGNQVDQLALTKCRLAIYSSEWAANTAIQNYDVDLAKVKVVPFGANISCNRNIYDIQSILENKDYNICRLLFIGTEWARKGGDVAVQVAERLNQRGIRSELHIIGCIPPVELPDFVKVHGFVSKGSQDGRQLLDDLFAQSHFFILPTQADCTPVVFPEACSFGLPSLTTNVGGIPTVIQNGKNGFTYPVDEGPEAYSDTIERLWSSKQEYEQLALSSFREYCERLNWATAGRKVYDLILEFCG